ncbi:MAG: transcriptional repressor [Candidatus Omnitrophica bacterium]|jgi:Fur family ferric uptake transcriptional regulator|nr:transcriptional repressor [Candidatus Omnitrophota bacterium]
MSQYLTAAEKKFETFLSENDLKYTSQRRTILLEAFGAKRHFGAEELLALVKKRDRTISKATLYRTLSLLTQSKILEEQDFGDGHMSYEPMLGKQHHDHLVCVKCKTILEFENAEIEKIQEAEARKQGFIIISHSHKLFGLCRRCS